MMSRIVLASALSFALACATAAPSHGSPAADLTPLFAAGAWLNGTATQATLRNKVVLVDIFTFDCINCKHVVPNLRRLQADEPSSRFAIVGIHSPETDYERDRGNVAKNLAEQGITWPVRIDNDFSVWQAYGIQYWPTQLIFDRHGRLRQTVIGEGRDDEVNAEIQALLAER